MSDDENYWDWQYTKVLTSKNDTSTQPTAALEIPRQEIDKLAQFLSLHERKQLMNNADPSTWIDVYEQGTCEKWDLLLTRVWNKKLGYLGKGGWGELVEAKGLKAGDQVSFYYKFNPQGINGLIMQVTRKINKMQIASSK
ncbi:hypothetical protein Dimus_018961 [Dionaea muscipula]